MRSSMSSSAHSCLWSSRIASASSRFDCEVGAMRCSASGMAAEPWEFGGGLGHGVDMLGCRPAEIKNS